MRIKVLGIYLIAILALLRFFIYPLHSGLKSDKVLLGEQYENYRIRAQILDRRTQNREEKVVGEKRALLPYLHAKGRPNSYIQSDVLEQVIKWAQKRELSVLNFEVLEPVTGKGITELPVLIRLKGKVGAFMGLLEDIERSEKLISFKSTEIAKSGSDFVFHLTLSSFKMEL